MGRNTPTYSAAERQAVAAAINSGVPASKVASLAASGELDGLPAFEIPVSSARDIAAANPSARRPPIPAEEHRERMSQLASQTLSVLERQREQIATRQQAADGDLQATDLTRLEKVARATKEVARLVSDLPEQARVPVAGAEAVRSETVDAMLRDMQQMKQEATLETDGASNGRTGGRG